MQHDYDPDSAQPIRQHLPESLESPAMMAAAYSRQVAPAAPCSANAMQFGSTDPGLGLPGQLLQALAMSPEFGKLPQLTPGSKAARRRKKGTTKRANALEARDIRKVEQHIFDNCRSPHGDLLKFRLSIRAGLRAGEIAGLFIEDMLAADGTIRDAIEVRTLKSRYRARKREIEMHPEIAEALAAVLEHHPTARHAAFSLGRGGTPRPQKASGVVNFFFRLYNNAGLTGCSSHSGRRTFATDVAQLLPAEKGSMRDLQIVMGHARLSSTECYLEPSNSMARIIRRLGR